MVPVKRVRFDTFSYGPGVMGLPKLCQSSGNVFKALRVSKSKKILFQKQTITDEQ